MKIAISIWLCSNYITQISEISNEHMLSSFYFDDDMLSDEELYSKIGTDGIGGIGPEPMRLSAIGEISKNGGIYRVSKIGDYCDSYVKLPPTNR